MALFLLEDMYFKGFWVKIKVMLNQIFSNLTNAVENLECGSICDHQINFL